MIREPGRPPVAPGTFSLVWFLQPFLPEHLEGCAYISAPCSDPTPVLGVKESTMFRIPIAVISLLLLVGSVLPAEAQSRGRAEVRSGQTATQTRVRAPSSNTTRTVRTRPTRRVYYPRTYWGGYYYRSWGFYPYLGLRGWGWWGWPYYTPYHPVFYLTADAGSIKLKVTPKDAEVYINGQHLGKARRFDGWPTKLHLDKGRYELILYKDGMETVRRDIEVLAHQRQKLRIEMTPGEATPVEEISELERMRRQQRESLYARYGRDREVRTPRATRTPPATPAGEGETGAIDMRREAGRLILTVHPPDAVIYVDGQFVASAADLERRGSRVVLDPGKHTLELFIPGRDPVRKTIEIEPGRDAELSIDLLEE